jgi:hypothetical protein
MFFTGPAPVSHSIQEPDVQPIEQRSIGGKMSSLKYTLSDLSRRAQRMIFLSVTAICLLGIIAYASIPDSNGVVHGCFKTSNGSLRVIDSPTVQCDPRNETAISWNQNGPQGPAGPQGPEGPAGPAGSATRLITIGTENTGFPELMSSCSAAIRSKEFVKQSDSSNLRITYHDTSLVNLNYTGGLSVDVLIDGSAAAPTPIDYIVQNGSSFTAFGYATGIPAGTHTLTTRYNFRGSLSPPSTCFRTDRYTVEIEEIQP